MNKDLEKLIDDAVAKENQLQAMSDSLALQSKQFADYLEAKRVADKELEVLWDMVKEYMVDNDIKEHETDFIKLKLTPSGKYRTEDVSKVADELCDIKKVLNNKKVKAYFELNHELPEGIESTGYVLRKTLK